MTRDQIFNQGSFDPEEESFFIKIMVPFFQKEVEISAYNLPSLNSKKEIIFFN